MDNLSMEADKVKESSEYKHLYQVLQTERKQHSEERSSLRVSHMATFLCRAAAPAAFVRGWLFRVH